MPQTVFFYLLCVNGNVKTVFLSLNSSHLNIRARAHIRVQQHQIRALQIRFIDTVSEFILHKYTLSFLYQITLWKGKQFSEITH